LLHCDARPRGSGGDCQVRVLVVDDHLSNRKLLRIQLEAEGNIVLEAANGCDALAVLGSDPVDAVISDILMPVMDGYSRGATFYFSLLAPEAG